MNSEKGQTMETVTRSLLLRGCEEKGRARQSTEDSQRSPAALDTVTVPVRQATQRVKPNIRQREHWRAMLCPCRLVNYNKLITLVGDADKRGRCAVWGQGYTGDL